MIKVEDCPRAYTRAVLAVMEDGVASPEAIVLDLLNYMSEADVKNYVELHMSDVIECETEENYEDDDMVEKVLYVGATDAQVNWGGCDDPRGLLEEGKEYTLLSRDVHSWHTKIELEEFPGLRFNSVCFNEEQLTTPCN